MSILVNSNISSSLIRPNVLGSTVDLPFRRTDFLNFLRENGLVVASNGSQPFKWNLINDVNSSAEVFSEGQAAPVAGKQTYQQASLSPFYARVVVGYSGHVRDNRGGMYEDAVALEIAKGTADLFKKVEDTLLNSTQDQGIAAIIDSAGTYAGLAAGTVTQWASEENGTVGTLTITAVEDLYEELVSASGGSSVPRGANPTHILFPPNQITNWTRTIGASASTSLMRFAPPAMGGGVFDPGMLGAGLVPQLAWNGRPVVSIAGITSTEGYMIDAMSGFELVVHRDVEVIELARTSDDVNFQISFACALKVARRNAHGKMTGITA